MGSTRKLFPALLRYWRGRRGMSQLALGLAAEVSPRHVSFLESARARPSPAMVLRLFGALGVPLRVQDEALVAAGHEPRFASADPVLPVEVDAAIAQMMAQHEPFPLAVLRVDGTLLRTNRGAANLFRAFIAEPDVLLEQDANLFAMLFDSRHLRPYIVEWPAFGRSLASRLHREYLDRGDARLGATLDRIFALPDVPRQWRQPDFSRDVPATAHLRFERDGLAVAFLVTITTFSSPRRAMLEDLHIESCFPLDAHTRDVCAKLAGPSGEAPSARRPRGPARIT